MANERIEFLKTRLKESGERKQKLVGIRDNITEQIGIIDVEEEELRKELEMALNRQSKLTLDDAQIEQLERIFKPNHPQSNLPGINESPDQDDDDELIGSSRGPGSRLPMNTKAYKLLKAIHEKGDHILASELVVSLPQVHSEFDYISVHGTLSKQKKNGRLTKDDVTERYSLTPKGLSFLRKVSAMGLRAVS